MATKAMELLNGVPEAASGVGRADWSLSLSNGSLCADDASQKAGACHVEIGRSLFRLRFWPVAGRVKSKLSSDAAAMSDVNFNIRGVLLSVDWAVVQVGRIVSPLIHERRAGHSRSTKSSQ